MNAAERVKKVDHYYVSINAVIQPIQVREKNRTLRRQGELMTSLFSLLSACPKAGLMEEDDLYKQL
ncbi:MAG: hypothetical protein COZ69_03040 [Deltaproteobacteria bacterium CG_4_8_14_3_um_filter_45_9]|nr:MAG: hypothetical protein COZ69_03040 [Deltaproteobacteria bacterium CG_4_8_14_3_um_filter_45_9]